MDLNEVHRITIKQLQATIYETPESGDFAVAIGRTVNSDEKIGVTLFSRDELLLVQELAKRSRRWVCNTQGDTTGLES